MKCWAIPRRCSWRQPSSGRFCSCLRCRSGRFCVWACCWSGRASGAPTPSGVEVDRPRRGCRRPRERLIRECCRGGRADGCTAARPAGAGSSPIVVTEGVRHSVASREGPTRATTRFVISALEKFHSTPRSARDDTPSMCRRSRSRRVS